MNGILGIHIAAGTIALLTGTAAIAARKGKRVHVTAGTWFCISMFVLGITASILGPFRTPPESPIGGIMVCYFVATAWLAARNRSGTAGRFDRIAGAAILVIAALTIGQGVERVLAEPGEFPEVPSAGALFSLGAVCLFAGLSDLKFIFRGALSARQRTLRHLWRMCFAFFIATGSFFLGQQDVMPEVLRGSAVLWFLAFAPFGVLGFWVVRVRFFSR
jgi:hypothetical protein